MATIGHPLSDISNLLTPYFTARLDPARSVNVRPGFKPRATRGLPTPDEITTLYFSVAGSRAMGNGNSNGNGDGSDRNGSASSLELSLPADAQARDRARELQWAQAFNMFRQAAICQGIAARQAGRQASSEKARRYADARFSLAEFAWELVQSARTGGEGAGHISGSGSGSGPGPGFRSGRGPESGSGSDSVQHGKARAKL